MAIVIPSFQLTLGLPPFHFFISYQMLTSDPELPSPLIFFIILEYSLVTTDRYFQAQFSLLCQTEAYLSLSCYHLHAPHPTRKSETPCTFCCIYSLLTILSSWGIPQWYVPRSLRIYGVIFHLLVPLL